MPSLATLANIPRDRSSALFSSPAAALPASPATEAGDPGDSGTVHCSVGQCGDNVLTMNVVSGSVVSVGYSEWDEAQPKH